MTAALIGVGVLLLVAIIGLIIHVGVSAGNTASPWTRRNQAGKDSGKSG